MDIETFCQPILESRFIESLAYGTKRPLHELRAYIQISIREAEFMLSLLSSCDLTNGRVLEFGAGLGILGSYLNSQGVDIYMLEPGGIGFEQNALLINEVANKLSVAPRRIITKTIEEVVVTDLERFNLIFSNNTLEHVKLLNSSLMNLLRILRPGGLMLHHCPNYLIPFEPHYGIPLIPFLPRLTRWFLSEAIVGDSCWKSLNFINAIWISRFSRKNGIQVHFRKGMFYKSFLRFENDSSFKLRHSKILPIYKVLKSLYFINLLKLIPGSLNSPMVFELRAKNEAL